MYLIHTPRFVNFLRSRLLPTSVLGALLPITVFSQSISGSASLRGTAKINDTFVVRGVMVVLTPTDNGSPGRPRPAWVGVDGEYRIDDVTPGTYILKATGKPIKLKILASVKIAEGNRNVQNITLEKADPANLKTTILNSQGKPLGNAKIAVYSAALPPSVCEQCVVAEIRSNDSGEVENLEVALGEDYTLAVSVYDEATKGELTLIAPNIISLGSKTQTRIELQVSGGSQPVLTAKLLPDIQPAPTKRDNIRPSELANVPDSKGVTTNPDGVRTVATGQKLKLRGVVIRRDADTFTVRNLVGVDTIVRLDDQTSVRVTGAFLRGGANYAQTSILRGLNLQVEGRGNTAGELGAEKVRFSESDMRVARAVESRAAPLEERAAGSEARVGQIEANAQRLSGQLEELAAVSNAARGGARAAQATADAAVAGVNTTNDRISSLDDYTPQTTAAVNFRAGSAVLSPDAQAALDEIAGKALNAKGYVVEVSGFADSSGSIDHNRALSQRRADAVIRYLVEKHDIPLRRIVTPYGYGETNPVADNATREGRAQNRRVEIKLLVNKGLSPTPTMNPNP